MSESVNEIMEVIGVAARNATRTLSLATNETKSTALIEAAATLRSGISDVLAANEQDMANGTEAGLSESMLDRLQLDEGRVEAIATSLESIAALQDPVGEVIAQWDRPNGLQIERVRTPLGVIGVIYESRPNVTADAGALCLKAGNAVILRGGSDSFYSSRAIHQCMAKGLEAAGLPVTAIQIVPTTDRAAVGEMLAGLNGNLDVLVPRGGKSLVARVQQDSRVPVFAHLEGICHVFIDHEAEIEMAINVVVNSKMRRTGICGAAETLLLDRRLGEPAIKRIVSTLQGSGCEILGDDTIRGLVDNCKVAKEEDWRTEFLAAKISVKVVSGVEEAVDHIARYSSHHTESIVTTNEETACKFMNEIDSAILLHNASTQFADGGEFGMGAEIGIATGKMHARGPVGVEQLTSFKYRVRGSGQVRS